MIETWVGSECHCILRYLWCFPLSILWLLTLHRVTDKKKKKTRKNEERERVSSERHSTLLCYFPLRITITTDIKAQHSMGSPGRYKKTHKSSKSERERSSVGTRGVWHHCTPTPCVVWHHHYCCPTPCAGVPCVSCSLQAEPQHYQLQRPAVCSVSTTWLRRVCNSFHDINRRLFHPSR